MAKLDERGVEQETKTFTFTLRTFLAKDVKFLKFRGALEERDEEVDKSSMHDLRKDF